MAYKPLITVRQVQQKLSGIAAVLNALGEGEVQSQIKDAIGTAQSRMEEESHVWLYTRKVLTYPGQGDSIPTTYDLQVDPLDYYTSSYPQSARFDLKHRPVQSIQRVAVEYGPTRSLFAYPPEYLRINHRMGSVSIVPLTNMGIALASAGSEYLLPLLRGGVLRGIVPLMVSIDYTAGIPDADTNPEYAQLRETLIKRAAAQVRENNAGLIAKSVGRDGVSVSFDDNMSQIEMLNTQADAYTAQFRQSYAPVRMQFI